MQTAKIEADLPLDMLLEIASWCDYPDLYNLLTALTAHKFIENCPLFWQNYFQKMFLHKGEKMQKFYRRLMDAKNHFSNIEKCKYLSIWNLFQISEGNNLEKNSCDVVICGGTYFYKSSSESEIPTIKKCITNALSEQYTNLITNKDFGEIFGHYLSDGHMNISIAKYPGYGIFSINLQRGLDSSFSNNTDNTDNVVLFMDYVNNVKFLQINVMQFNSTYGLYVTFYKNSEPKIIYDF